MDWYSSDGKECLERSISLYSFDERIKEGFPIEENMKNELIKEYKLIDKRLRQCELSGKF